MRQIRPFFLCVLLIFSLLAVSCTAKRLESEAEANDYRDATAYRDAGRRERFTGVLTEVGEYSVQLKADEETGSLTGRTVRIAVSGSVKITDNEGNPLTLADLAPGDPVRITYDGSVLLTDPPRISVCYEIRRMA